MSKSTNQSSLLKVKKMIIIMIINKAKSHVKGTLIASNLALACVCMHIFSLLFTPAQGLLIVVQQPERPKHKGFTCGGLIN